MKLSQEELDAILTRNPALAKLNQDAGAIGTFHHRQITQSVKVPAITVTQIEPKKRPLLNKTETLWRVELERRGHKIILAQAITFNLGDRLTYRPDLIVVECGERALDYFKAYNSGVPFLRLTCYETKAPHRFATAGITKIKAAAKQYPFIRFVLVMRDKGKWTERTIGNE